VEHRQPRKRSIPASKLPNKTMEPLADTRLRRQSCKISGMRTFEAIIDEQGRIRLLQPLEAGAPRRALVVLLDEAIPSADEAAALSEEALADWNRPEEDSAWSHLQRVK
jgi:hypothetical protein